MCLSDANEMTEALPEETPVSDETASWIDRVVSLLDRHPMTPAVASVYMFPDKTELRDLTTEARNMLREESTRRLAERINPDSVTHALVTMKLMHDQMKSLMRSLRREMYAITDEDREKYTRFLEWLYHARCGAVITFSDNIVSTSQCMAPTMQKRRCKQKMQSPHGAHLPGTCRLHTPSHSDFVTWLNTEDRASLPHIKETNDLWIEGCRVTRAIEELYEKCEKMSKMSVVASTTVPDEIRGEWDRSHVLTCAFHDMNRAVDRYDALHAACHEWAMDNHAVCPICMEFLPKDRAGTVKLPCGHDLCIVCFKSMNHNRHQSNSSCPVCRAAIP